MARPNLIWTLCFVVLAAIALVLGYRMIAIWVVLFTLSVWAARHWSATRPVVTSLASTLALFALIEGAVLSWSVVSSKWPGTTETALPASKAAPGARHLLQSEVDKAYIGLWLSQELYGDRIRPIVMGRNAHTEYFNTNSLGFRAPEFTPKAPGTKRIILLGGSGAFGYQAINDDATISAQLQSMLNEGAPAGTRYEVLNLAVPAGNSAIDLNIVAAYAPILEPDLILFYTATNDLNGNVENVDRIGTVATDLLVRWHVAKYAYFKVMLVDYARSYLSRVSYLARMVFDHFQVSDAVWVGDQTIHTRTDAEYQRFRQIYFTNMDWIFRIATRLRIPVIVGQQVLSATVEHAREQAKTATVAEGSTGAGSKWQTFVANSYDGLLAEGEQLAGKYGFAYCSLLEPFKTSLNPLRQGAEVDLRDETQGGPLYMSGSHLTLAGTRLVAREFATIIRQGHCPGS